MDMKFRDNFPSTLREQALQFARALEEKSSPIVRGFTSYGARKVDETAHGTVLEFIGVSEGIKRDGSKIQVAGIDTRGLESNPVFLWAHQYDRPPIGRIVSVSKGRKEGLGKIVKIRVAPLQTDVDSEHRVFADMILDMFVKGDMRTVSFGWSAVEAEPMLDEAGFFQGWDFKRSDALEFSGVPVPADPDAIMLAVRSRGLSESVIDQLVANRRPSKPSVYQVREISGDIDWEATDEDEEVSSDSTDSQRSESDNERAVERNDGDTTPSVEALTSIVRDTIIKEVAAIVKEQLDAAIPATTRKGAVLSRTNKDALSQARQLIDDVLKHAEAAPDEPATSNTPQESDERAATDAELADLENWVATRTQERAAKHEKVLEEIFGRLAATKGSSKKSD